MPVTAKWYTNALKWLCRGDVIWKAAGGSTIKLALLSAYTPNQDTHVYWGDVLGNVVSIKLAPSDTYNLLGVYTYELKIKDALSDVDTVQQDYLIVAASNTPIFEN